MTEYQLRVVIIAKRNTSISFSHALNSILKQAYTPIRILVVDANEPNSLYSLGLQEDLADYPEVEYLQVDQSLSPAGIKNEIVQYVEEEYLAFLSNNDVWDSLKALLQMEQFKKEPGAAASCCSGVLIDERKQEVVTGPLDVRMNMASLYGMVDNPVKRSSQVIYRTSAVKHAGGFDGQFNNLCDADLLLRLCKQEKVMILPVSLVECKITAEDEEYDLNSFRDGQRFLYKYMELFVRDRLMTRSFYARMAQLAKINYLWLNYLAYNILYFWKAPGRTAFSVFRRAGWSIYYALKWIRWRVSLLRQPLVYRRRLDRLMRGRPFQKRASCCALAEGKAGKELTLASVYEYNAQNPLTYIFDRKLKSIVLPDYVKVIKDSMFYGCEGLVSIEIPSTVLEIQEHAFQGCKSLRHITIREGSRLGKIGAYAFAGCSSLEAICLPAGVSRIGAGAFAWCDSLEQLTFTYLHRGAVRTTGCFPEALARIARYTFAGCTRLKGVEFGANSLLETVEQGAFIGCGALKRSVMTGNVSSLGAYCFAYCRALETAAFPQIDSMKWIGKGAFLHCEALAYFLFPSKLEQLKVRTFYGCSSLKSVKIPMKVLSIDHQAFARCRALSKAIILSGDAAVSPTAFDKHTQVEIQQGAVRENAS